jgi:hypothetical protein
VASLNLAVRFLIELAMLFSFGFWGWQQVSGQPMRTLVAIALPVLAAAIWGGFVAPKARRRLEDPSRLLLEVILFGSGAAALMHAGARTAGVVLAVVAGLSLALMFVFGQRGL